MVGPFEARRPPAVADQVARAHTRGNAGHGRAGRPEGPVAPVCARPEVAVRRRASRSGTSVAFTYSFDPPKMQLVVCPPNGTSSRISPADDTMLTRPEIVRRTNSRGSSANAMPSGT